LDLGWPISERSSLVPNIWIHGGLLEGGLVGLDNNDLRWIRVAHWTQEKATWAVFQRDCDFVLEVLEQSKGRRIVQNVSSSKGRIRQEENNYLRYVVD
jgi:hypothetical protein